MAENTTPTANDVLFAQALNKMNKSANRVKSDTLLAAIVEFINTSKRGESHKNFERKYNVTASRLVGLIRKNEVLANRVWAVQNDEYGVCLVNVTPEDAS